MTDPRVNKLAKVLVNYSLSLKPDDKFVVRTSPIAEELNLAVYEEAIKAGAFVSIMQTILGAREAFYKYSSLEQLDHVSDFEKLTTETFDAYLAIDASHNTRILTGIDPAIIARVSKANAHNEKIFFERSGKGDLCWSLTVYPTNAFAQEAEMSLSSYQDFVYGAGILDDPVRLPIGKRSVLSRKNRWTG